ncbi:hypothetical protein ACIRYZ_22965 [Kitasatospora sp. NPDC101155]|uniref:hypothetical protein n=1 Tax=Kitasatospora sp. NPDC101155 TaxID=3364097 RepID=UPI003806A42F
MMLAGRSAAGDWRDVVSSRIALIAEQGQRLAIAQEHLTHMLNCPRDNPAADCPELRAEVRERHGVGYPDGDAESGKHPGGQGASSA